MARPLSEEKRTALLSAATALLAANGVSATTLQIAKTAGVAEGTLFRYFSTKEELLNKVYLDLKIDLISYLSIDWPKDTSVKAQFEHLWMRFIDWGLGSPEKYKALRYLEVSLDISESTRQASEAFSNDLQHLLEKGFASGALREQPLIFLWGVIQSLANVVLEGVSRELDTSQEAKRLGWEALWGAISK